MKWLESDAPVTPSMIVAVVYEIAKIQDDDEAAHSLEDRLHRAVLRAVAEGRCEDPARCAELATTSLDLTFGRFCA